MGARIFIWYITHDSWYPLFRTSLLQWKPFPLPLIWKPSSISSWWFQPIWKRLVNLDHFPFPQVEVKITNVWNHHSDIYKPSLPLHQSCGYMQHEGPVCRTGIRWCSMGKEDLKKDFAPQIYHREWLLENNSCRVVDKFGVNDWMTRSLFLHVDAGTYFDMTTWSGDNKGKASTACSFQAIH